MNDFPVQKLGGTDRGQIIFFFSIFQLQLGSNLEASNSQYSSVVSLCVLTYTAPAYPSIQQTANKTMIFEDDDHPRLAEFTLYINTPTQLQYF
jgi:hypothetical protein